MLMTLLYTRLMFCHDDYVKNSNLRNESIKTLSYSSVPLSPCSHVACEIIILARKNGDNETLTCQ